MKRSEINHIIDEAIAFLDEMKFKLPPFAHWTPTEWQQKGADCRDIVRQNLGWDITDFGSGEFDRVGLFLFTLRNGTAAAAAAGTGRSYAEKVMIVQENQVTPCHTHKAKMEDIINRGGGGLVVQLWADNGATAPDAAAPVTVKLDGVERTVAAGEKVVLDPGASITLEPGHFHSFWGAPGRGTTLVGEVSQVNDDTTDNYFVPACGRFPDVVEDQPPVRLLIPDYPDYCDPALLPV